MSRHVLTAANSNVYVFMIRLLGRTSSLVLLTGLALIATQLAEAQGAESDYMMHAGDELEVSVWKEVDLQRKILVRPDGKFSFPLTGEVQAAGRSPAEIRADIESRLRAYIPEPVVTVTVTGVNGNGIYVIGQVNKPGAFVMNPRLSVLQALSVAGGTTPFAKLDNIIVIRMTGGTQRSLPFQYNQVSEGKNLAQNIALEAGDVVVVP
jgi:polysaccharide export outer membrane protein